MIVRKRVLPNPTRVPQGASACPRRTSTFRYWGDERTIYVHHGKGGRTWDIDGNCMSITAWATARPFWAMPMTGRCRARKGMEVGGVFALSTERELIVAERIAKMVPAAELVRYSNSGTEAVMAALRLPALTRAATAISWSKAATMASSMRPCGCQMWTGGTRTPTRILKSSPIRRAFRRP
jgi:hypothetical protein